MADEIISSAADDAGEPTSAESRSAETASQPVDDATPKSGWSRRTFFQAAALGAAAAAFLDAKRFVPSIAWANDLSTKPCTGGDVEIIGTGIVTNEPCHAADCGGTYDAIVQFTVRNNTSSDRYCIGLHLVPDGKVLTAPFDILLVDSPSGTGGGSTATGKSGGESFHDTTMYGTIPNFPCGGAGGLICFGEAGTTRGKCAAGTCTTIAWNTSSGDANCSAPDQNPAGGQCRHQQVCIQVYGASLTCVGSDCTTAGSCAVQCGGSLHLLATVAGGSPNYTYVLHGDDGSMDQTVGPTSATSTCFTVTPTQNTTYKLTVTDNNGCTRTATRMVTTNPVTVSVGVEGGIPDAGVTCNTAVAGVSFKATPANCSGTATYQWRVDGVVQNGVTGDTFSYGNHIDQVCHTVSVKVTCGSCTSDPASRTIQQCVHSVVGAAGSTCPP